MENLLEVAEKPQPKKTSQVYFLLKFGEEEHLKSLVEKGIIYLGAINKLREGDNHKFDSYEGATFIKGFVGGGIIESSHPTLGYLKMKFESGTYKETYETLYGNICSFYAITQDHFTDSKLTSVDSRMQEFGSHFVMINMSEFMKRLRKKLEELKLKYHGRLVEYYDEKSYEGRRGLFNKRNKFEYQKEYRLYIENQEAENPITITLDDLSDIAWIAPSNTVDKLTMDVTYSIEVDNVIH